jgi:hypothetical protein
MTTREPRQVADGDVAVADDPEVRDLRDHVVRLPSPFEGTGPPDSFIRCERFHTLTSRYSSLLRIPRP